MAEIALPLADVCRRFRIGGRVVRAVDGVSAAAEAGAVTGLIGPDGAASCAPMPGGCRAG